MPDEKRRIIDEDQTLNINPDDLIYIDSVTNGSRVISYSDLCKAVALTLGIEAIKTTADGAMQINTYDKNRDGVVDNAAALETHNAAYFAKATDLDAVKKTADNAMKPSTYDANGNGIVDNAEKVNNHTVASDVPPNAIFTDTVYDDTAIKGTIDSVSKTAADNAALLAALGLVVVEGRLNAVWNT